MSPFNVGGAYSKKLGLDILLSMAYALHFDEEPMYQYYIDHLEKQLQNTHISLKDPY